MISGSTHTTSGGSGGMFAVLSSGDSLGYPGRGVRCYPLAFVVLYRGLDCHPGVRRVIQGVRCVIQRGSLCIRAGGH